MASPARRSTVSIDAKLHRGLRAKARKTARSISELVDEAVRRSMIEDAEDHAAFERRAGDRSHDFTQAVGRLQRGGSRFGPKAKHAVRGLLDRLPDDCTLEDVLYHVFVLQRISQGLAQANSGQLIPHEEVERDLWRRWRLGAG